MALSYVTMSHYSPDLALIHDVGFGQFARNATPWLLKTLKEKGIADGLVIDLGCGSGIWAEALCEAGYDVLGIDQSAAMVAMCRKRVPSAVFKQCSFLDADLPRCRAVTALGEIFNYLFDPRNGPKPLTEFFGKVYKALEPGGLFIFDVAEPGRGKPYGKTPRFIEGDGWAVGVRVEETKNPPVLTRWITSFRKIGSQFRRTEEIHRLHLYRGTELASALRNSGFRVRLLRNYGGTTFPTAYAGILACKKSNLP